MADAWAVGLVVLLGTWTAVFAGTGAGRPVPVLALLAGLVAAGVLGRIAGTSAPAVVAVAVAAAVIVSWPEALSAAGAPTGYANTNATLAGIGVVASAGAALTAPSTTATRIWWGLAAALGLVVLATGSVAGAASLLIVLALAALALVVRWPPAAVAGGVIVVSIVAGTTAVIAAGGDPLGLGGRAGVRADLWADAAELAARNPMRGIGPGEFATRNTVSSDADLRWAHHGYLQILAEWGAVGFGLVVALVGCIWARLWEVSTDRRPMPAVVASSAVVLVGLHATVDHVFHEPGVLLGVGVLVGWGTRRRSWNTRREVTTTQGDGSCSTVLDF